MTPAVVLYEAVGVVADLATRTRRRITWTIEDVRGLWSAVSALPWVPEDPEPPVTGYVAPGLERILPDPPLSRDALAVHRVIGRAIDGATPDELDRLLLDCLNEEATADAIAEDDALELKRGLRYAD